MSNRAVFLDRDGTLIEHYDYLTDPDQVKIMPTAAPALRMLKDRGYALVVITNQSAVARGMITEQKLLDIHSRLKALLAEQGVYLDQIYYCPYHPEGVIDKYRRESPLRKPSPGMLELASQELDIDLARSWMIGDDDRDIQAGAAAGCRTVFLESHRASPLVHTGGSKPDFQAVNLREAANLIIRHADRSPAGRESHDSASRSNRQSSDVVPSVPQVAATRETPQDDQSDAQARLQTATALKNHSAVLARDDNGLAVLSGPEPAPSDVHDDAAVQNDSADSPDPGAQSHRRRAHTTKRLTKNKPFTPESVTSRELLVQILRELQAQNRHSRFSEFSVPKLIAGIVQMLVLLCLILVFWFGSGPEPNIQAKQTYLQLAMVLQTLTLTLLVMHRQQ